MKVFNMKEQDQMVGADPFQRVPSTFVKVYSKEMLNALNMLRGRWYCNKIWQVHNRGGMI